MKKMTLTLINLTDPCAEVLLFYFISYFDKKCLIAEINMYHVF